MFNKVISKNDELNRTDDFSERFQGSFLMSNSLPDTVDELILLVASSQETSDDVRIQGITALGNLLAQRKGDFSDARGLLCLIEVIKKDENPRIVGHAMSVLGRLKATSAVMVMIDVVLGTGIFLFEGPEGEDFRGSDPCLRLRCTAAQALGQFQDERSVIPLMSVLNDKTVNYRLRMKAAESLGKAGDTHALGSLMDILEDEREKSIYLKESTAKALGMLGDIRAMDALLNVLESKRGIRDKFDFLKERSIESIRRLMGKSEGSADHLDKVTKSLLQSLKDEASSIRLAAVEAIGESEDSCFIENLHEMVSDPVDDVAIAAIHSVFLLGGEEAVRGLRTLENLPQFLRDEIEAYIP